ncbi:hypothetical protein L2E82_39302 [Cichorium intybus]|uniref:Uncharacterized protein n=1 Tax=Cichorium intybus TaxID=13427 RepID=A0ACB9AM90_CICIN|nr:hypothetical protein L2E82_39302 [Cichorium intybus]
MIDTPPIIDPIPIQSLLRSDDFKKRTLMVELTMLITRVSDTFSDNMVTAVNYSILQYEAPFFFGEFLEEDHGCDVDVQMVHDYLKVHMEDMDEERQLCCEGYPYFFVISSTNNMSCRVGANDRDLSFPNAFPLYILRLIVVYSSVDYL